MKLQLIAIFDRKAQTFVSLTPTPSINVAIRDIQEAVNTQKENNIAKWPEDHSLWHLGEWDGETGRLLPLEDKKLILEIASLKG